MLARILTAGPECLFPVRQDMTGGRTKMGRAWDDAAKKLGMAGINSTLGSHRAAAVSQVRQTATKDIVALGLSEALQKHEPATEVSFALPRLGKKSMFLADRGKATIVEALVCFCRSVFSSNALKL